MFVDDKDSGESWLLQVFVDDKSCWLQAGGCECLLAANLEAAAFYLIDG